MYKLVLVRHGQSTWNLENRFTGWTDVDLTDTGVRQAQHRGAGLRVQGIGKVVEPGQLSLQSGGHGVL